MRTTRGKHFTIICNAALCECSNSKWEGQRNCRSVRVYIYAVSSRFQLICHQLFNNSIIYTPQLPISLYFRLVLVKAGLPVFWRKKKGEIHAFLLY